MNKPLSLTVTAPGNTYVSVVHVFEWLEDCVVTSNGTYSLATGFRTDVADSRWQATRLDGKPLSPPQYAAVTPGSRRRRL